jgi:signal transduction histidine kinase
MRRTGLRLKFIVLLTSVIVVMLGVFVLWSNNAQQAQAEREMLEKAQILSREMDAVWEFFEVNQHQFNVGENGSDELYCVIAAKAVSKFFTEDSDYVIHYTNLTTRRPSDAPDEFETSALNALHANRDLAEFYGTESGTDEGQVFRYIKPLYVSESCLECHGDPQGELDKFGFPKEGQKVGDIAGAISIVMPIDLYMGGIRSNINQGIFIFALVAVAVFAVIFFGISRLVTKPLREFETAAERIEDGDLSVNLEGIGNRDEIHDLALRFNSMSKQLRNLYENLENQVETRTVQLASANRELEDQRRQLEEANRSLLELSQYKSDFLAIMSHELRTPLTSILAFTEMWEQSCAHKDEEEHAAVQEIQANGQILLNMVDNILEMARVETGKAELILETVDLVDLVSTVEGSLSFLAERRNITFTATVDPNVPLINADWEKLRRIIVNLISNAIKFTKKGGEVDVRVSRSPKGDQVLIAVSDTGIGISEENLEHIFERFTQSDRSSVKRYSGSGLGLAVVKELVEIQGGSIEVTSAHKKGSTFAVSIPMGDNDWEELP